MHRKSTHTNYYNLKFLHSPKRLRNIQLFQRGSKKICFRKIQSHNIVLIIFYLLCNIFLNEPQKSIQNQGDDTQKSDGHQNQGKLEGLA